MNSLLSSMKVMLVEDEQFVRDDLRELVAGYPELTILWEAESLKDARAVLRRYTPDILLLDVQLRDGIGFDLLDEVSEATRLVFVSGYDEYALKAFEVNAFDYVLKPVQRSRFELLLARIMKHRHECSRVANLPPDAESRISIRSGTKTEAFLLNDLVAITCLGGNYTEIATTNQSRIETRRTVQEWEEVLPHREFIRVHRSTIVNLRHVICLRSHSSRTFELEVQHLNAPVDVSRRLVQQVRAALEEWNHTEPHRDAVYSRGHSFRSSA